jgi:hypothetical protein
VTSCQAIGIKNQRKKIIEEYKVDMSFIYPAWNQDKYFLLPRITSFLIFRIRLLLTGKPEVMNKLSEKIMAIMELHLSFSMQIKDDYSKNLVVGQKGMWFSVFRVMGPHLVGSNAKLIQEKSGTILHIDLYNSLTLIGSAKGIEIAKEMIKDSLAKRYVNVK